MKTLMNYAYALRIYRYSKITLFLICVATIAFITIRFTFDITFYFSEVLVFGVICFLMLSYIKDYAFQRVLMGALSGEIELPSFLRHIGEQITQKEKYFKEKEAWYQNIIDAIPFTISVTDVDMHWTLVNKKSLEFYAKNAS